MAQITIGGEAVSASLNSFVKLKATWDYIQAAQAEGEMFKKFDLIIKVLAVASLSAEAISDTVEDDGTVVENNGAAIKARALEFAARLTGQEMTTLPATMNGLLIEAGLVERPGKGE